MEKLSGIYRIFCESNGDYYYGSSKNIHIRWGAHKRILNKQKHTNHRLQNMWDKYDKSHIRWELIELVPEDDLLKVEDQYLKEHVGKSHCMNISKDAYAPMRGRSVGACPEETKEKIRQTLMGHSVSEETRKKIGEMQRGKKCPCSESRRTSIARAKRPKES